MNFEVSPLFLFVFSTRSLILFANLGLAFLLAASPIAAAQHDAHCRINVSSDQSIANEVQAAKSKGKSNDKSKDKWCSNSEVEGDVVAIIAVDKKMGAVNGIVRKEDQVYPEEGHGGEC